MEREVKLRNYISYGMGDILGGGSFALIGIFFIIYMTEVVGMLPSHSTLIYAISKIWDAFSDPMMGYISDRTKSRFGRRRIYFLIGIVPVGVFFALIWTSVNIQHQFFLFLWYLVILISFSTFFTILMVPYTALNADMSLDYVVRSKLSGFKQLLSGASSAVCTVASQPLVNSFPDQQTGFMVMGIVFGVLFSIPWIFVFLGTWEVPRKHEVLKKQSTKEIFGNFLSVFRNRSFRIHIGMYVSGFAAMDIVMATLIIFLTHYVGKVEYFPFMMISFALSQGAFMPIYIFIGNKYGKGKAYLIGASIFLAGILFASTLSPGESLPVLLAAAAFLGSGMCGVTVMPWVMLPSVTDVDELITSQKRAGTYSGMMTLLRKLTNALTIFVIGNTLEYVGYLPNVVLGEETKENMRLIFLITPFIAVFIGWLFSFRFKINYKTHGILRGEIERLDAGGSKEDASKETKDVCEELTGIDYDDLYKPLS